MAPAVDDRRAVAAAGWTREDQLVDDRGELSAFFEREILGHYDAGERGTLRGAGGLTLAHRGYPIPDARGALVVVSGRSEQMAKYAELIYDLRRSGYAVYLLDHRGQGESGRLLAAPTKGHVDAFARYVDDLDRFLTTVVRAARPRRVFALGHSMGGAITALHAARHPGGFDAIVLASPMLQIAAERASPMPARLARLAVRLGAGARSIPAKDNVLTLSAARDAVRRAIERRYPATVIDRPTFGWADQAFAASREARARAGQITAPVLILQAMQDQVVSLEAQHEVCRRINTAGGACRLHLFPDAVHELFQERDGIRDEAIAATLAFFDHHAASPS
jgi:lysophospholipase